MPRNTRLSMLAFAVLLLVSAPGCGDSNDVVDQPAEVSTSVQGVSPGVVDAVGESDLAGATISGLMGLITTSDPAAQAGVAFGVTPSCPETFELPSGITGTCTSLPSGGVSFVFSGTIEGPHGPVTVNGTLVAAPTDDQPPTGSRWSVDFDATAVGPRGTATWSATGTFTLDANDDVVDYSIAYTHTRTVQGGPSVVVTITITPDHFSIVIAGSGGFTLRFDVNRATMTGTIRFDGIVVASIAFENDCVSVNYVNPNLPDVTICAED